MFKAVCVIATIFVFASLGFAQAQPPSAYQQLRFETPFAFHIGDHEVPAGEYVIHWTGNGFAMVNSRAGGTGGGIVACVVGTVSQQSELHGVPAIVFNQYGDAYFLSQMWQGNGVEGIQAIKTKQEREMVSSKVKVAQGDVRRVTVLASVHQ
jgi:hypothetical protein